MHEQSQESRSTSIPDPLKLISVIYAIVCCIAGIVIPTAEALNNAWLDTVFGAIFLSYQLIVGNAFLIYLIVLSYVVRSKDKMHGAQSGLDLGPTRENDYCESRQTSTTCTGSEASLSRQTDSGDAESTASSSSVFWVDVSDFGDAFTHPETSLFLKLGSLVFSLGNLIYYGFESASYIYLDESCYVRSKYGWTFFLRLVFVLLQTYFMFKRPDGQIKCHQSFIWFGMLHLISTNLCLWFRTVIQEILEENHLDTDHHDGNDTSHPPINEMMITDGPTQYSDDGFTCNNSLLPNMTRYLFPFVLEYSLIAFGTIGAILHSLDQASTGNRKFPRDIQCVVAFTSSDPSASSSAGDENPTSAGTTSPSAAKEHEALSKAHTGFFVGALVMAGVVVSIILFHVKPENSRSFNNLPTVIYLITDACLHGLLLVGCIVAFILMRPLAYVPKAISMDDVLIVIAMCGSLVLDLSIVLSASDFVRARISRRSALLDAARLASSVIAFAEVVIQALLLVFALRRYAARQQDVDRMPGRSVITMLIIGNVAVWIYRTVLAKGINTYREKQFYGEIPWLLIVNINLPLSLFFRFHCGICFADVWHLAYRPLKRTLYSGSVDPKAGALQRHCARTAGTENDAVQDTTNFASQPAVRPALFRVRSGSLPCIHENLIVNHGKR